MFIFFVNIQEHAWNMLQCNWVFGLLTSFCIEYSDYLPPSLALSVQLFVWCDHSLTWKDQFDTMEFYRDCDGVVECSKELW